jgi:hypothetical protein
MEVLGMKRFARSTLALGQLRLKLPEAASLDYANFNR